MNYLMSTPSISWPVWSAAGLGAMVSLLGALYDVRFMLVGLMICLSVTPMLAFFIFFCNILDTHIMLNVLPHTIESRTGGYLVRIYREDKFTDEEGKEASEWVETGRMTIFESKVQKRIERVDSSVLFLVDSPVKVLYIPKCLHSLPVLCDVRR